MAPSCLLLCFGNSCSWLKRIFHAQKSPISLTAEAPPQTRWSSIQCSPRTLIAGFKEKQKKKEKIGRELEKRKLKEGDKRKEKNEKKGKRRRGGKGNRDHPPPGAI